MEQFSSGQVIGTIGAVLVALVGMLVFVIKLVVPWMKSKIDEKNGNIGDLVAEAQRLISANCQMAEALLGQIRQGQTAQEQRLVEMQRNCEKHTQALEKLMQTIEERAA
jgi:F0F1-type ATP synthase membrane subunit b/b'